MYGVCFVLIFLFRFGLLLAIPGQSINQHDEMLLISVPVVRSVFRYWSFSYEAFCMKFFGVFSLQISCLHHFRLVGASNLRLSDDSKWSGSFVTKNWPANKQVWWLPAPS